MTEMRPTLLASNNPPAFPVIVVHLDDGHGNTSCADAPMPDHDPYYSNVPRYLCPGCQRAAMRSADTSAAPVDGSPR